MNEAQKDAIREADNYLKAAGLPTYSELFARPAPGVPEGFALVPKKPTPEMVRVGERDRRQSPTNLNPLTTWYAMLAAAQPNGE